MVVIGLNWLRQNYEAVNLDINGQCELVNQIGLILETPHIIHRKDDVLNNPHMQAMNLLGDIAVSPGGQLMISEFQGAETAPLNKFITRTLLEYAKGPIEFENFDKQRRVAGTVMYALDKAIEITFQNRNTNNPIDLSIFNLILGDTELSRKQNFPDVTEGRVAKYLVTQTLNSLERIVLVTIREQGKLFAEQAADVFKGCLENNNYYKLHYDMLDKLRVIGRELAPGEFEEILCYLIEEKTKEINNDKYPFQLSRSLKMLFSNLQSDEFNLPMIKSAFELYLKGFDEEKGAIKGLDDQLTPNLIRAINGSGKENADVSWLLDVLVDFIQTNVHNESNVPFCIKLIDGLHILLKHPSPKIRNAVSLKFNELANKTTSESKGKINSELEKLQIKAQYWLNWDNGRKM